MFRFPVFVVVAATLIAMAVSICTTLCVPAQEPQPGAAESKFQAAQSSISASINLLDAYIQENPRGKDVAVAKVQLTSLKALSPSSAAASPVPLGAREEGLQWHVASVDPRPEGTVVTLKIINPDEKRAKGMFAFDGEPLVMFDNQGTFYPMQEPPAVPPGVRVQQWGQTRTMWWFQPQRVVTLQVVFAPLALDAVGGRILYLQDPTFGTTTPAEFSLLNKAQTVK